MKKSFFKSVLFSSLFIPGFLILAAGYGLAWYTVFNANPYSFYPMFTLSCLVYLAGIFLVVITKPSFKNILLVAIPAISFIPLLNLIDHVRATKTTYVLPQNYSKAFVVVFNENAGVHPMKKNGRWVMNIPEDGILILDTLISYSDEVEEEFCTIMPGNRLEKIDAGYTGYTHDIDSHEKTKKVRRDDEGRTDSIETTNAEYALFYNDQDNPGPDTKAILDSFISRKVDAYRKNFKAKGTTR
ncbi:MAG: hypothetical protein QM791_15270 [Ferruginibacter sp.]